MNALIELQDIRKSYGGGDARRFDVLRGIDLSIHAGEFVAIVGASGSGKSTLMNILGCLDRPTSGEYRFAGENVAALDSDELAWLRREAFFVFQGYHLILRLGPGKRRDAGDLCRHPAAERHARAAALLDRLGLASRTGNRRTSCPAASSNGVDCPGVDERRPHHPRRRTHRRPRQPQRRRGHGAARRTGQPGPRGHPHHPRPRSAARAKRIIEIRDGLIISDTAADKCQRQPGALQAVDLRQRLDDGAEATGAWKGELLEPLQAAWRVMWINRFRTALTLLGIIIGVASVVVMLAVGEGSKRQVMAQMGAFGSNIIYLSGSRPTRARRRASSPSMTWPPWPACRRSAHHAGQRRRSRWCASATSTTVSYVGGNDTNFPDLQLAGGRRQFFTEADERNGAAVAVIGHKVRNNCSRTRANPIGQYILIENVPFQVIGVLEKGASSGEDSDDRIAMPYTAASVRLFGSATPNTPSPPPMRAGHETEVAIEHLLRSAQRQAGFRTDQQRRDDPGRGRTQNTLSLMLGAIAAISLLVGGIGVMNIMLMTVRERTREIGIRMATGARQRDILRQFLTEAVMLSMVGGVAGIVLALAIGGACCWRIAVAFSLPAMHRRLRLRRGHRRGVRLHAGPQAARLDPVKALTSE
jgi:macrolide transport system ATP-binding/permease protein